MITFRKDFDLWWPNYDHAPEKCHKRVMSYLKDLEPTIARCKRHRVAVQAGGHAGVWPRRLAQVFGSVFTFEPEPALYECLKRNLVDYRNVYHRQTALGNTSGVVRMRPHISAGSWSVQSDGTVPVASGTIDEMGLKHCDAIVLDIEGYEPVALLGAIETIRRCKPVIHIEELPRSKKQIAEFMSMAGYAPVATMHGDKLYEPRR